MNKRFPIILAALVSAIILYTLLSSTQPISPTQTTTTSTTLYFFEDIIPEDEYGSIIMQSTASACERITSPYQTHLKDGCYYRLADVNLDTSYCQKIMDPAQREKCVNFVVRKNKSMVYPVK